MEHRRAREPSWPTSSRDAFDKTEVCVTSTVPPPPANRPPVLAPISPHLPSLFVNGTLTVTAPASDPEGDAITWIWTFDLNQTQTTATGEWTHRFDHPGQFTLAVVARDLQGATSEPRSTTVFVVNRRPNVDSLSPLNPTIHPNESVTFTATASDPDGDLFTYIWRSADLHMVDQRLGAALVERCPIDDLHDRWGFPRSRHRQRRTRRHRFGRGDDHRHRARRAAQSSACDHRGRGQSTTRNHAARASSQPPILCSGPRW